MKLHRNSELILSTFEEADEHFYREIKFFSERRDKDLSRMANMKLINDVEDLLSDRFEQEVRRIGI